MYRVAVRLRLVLAVVCLLNAGLLSATGFPKLPQYPIALGGTTFGDFNGDGHLDFLGVVQCRPTPCSTSTVSVSLAYANGQYRLPITSTIDGFQVTGAKPGDFNGDHKLDIAFLSLVSGQTFIEIVLGNGDGTFGTTHSYPVPSNSSVFILGDVNGDGKLDVVVTNGGTLQVFLGYGDGTLQPLPLAPGGSAGCTLADVNHDGKLDLIGDGVQLGNGDGTFQNGQQISGAGGCPAIADFDGDGNLDVASPVQGGINLYLGNGDGTFKPPVYRYTSTTGDVLVGDFNGDGKPDLLARREGEIDILLNAGKGLFRPSVGYMEIGSPFLADLNGDGRTDMLLVAGTNSGQEVATPVLAGPGGTFALPRSYFLPGGITATAIMAGDLNNDGNLDLIEINQESLTWLGGHVNRLLGNGDGTFKSAGDSATGGRGSHSGALADLNADGKLDLVVASGDSLNVRLGLGDGNFQSAVSYPIQSTSVAVADFNGDGIPDLAVNRTAVTSSGYIGSGSILLGNGDGTFRTGSPLPGSFDLVVAGDFNGDGKQDLAVSSFNSVGILLGNGDGTFKPISGVRTGYTQFLLAADFNGDGKLDLAAVGVSAGQNTLASVYLGNGDGTLQPTRNFWVQGSTYPGGLVAADFNGDGKPDLAVSAGKIAVLIGDGTGQFQSPTLYSGGGGRLVVGDFDENGTQDLAVITSEESVAILLNK